MDFGTLLAYSMSRRSEMWQSNRETVVAFGIGVVALVLYGLVGAQDFAEHLR